LDFAFEELDIRGSGLALVLARECQHLVSHVEAVRFAGWTDAFGRTQHVDATARTEIEHRLARIERRECRRVAAPERRTHGFFWQRASLICPIQVRRDWITTC